MPSRSMRSSKRRRSSARSMLSTEVPRMGAPAAASGAARPIAVCPPNWVTTGGRGGEFTTEDTEDTEAEGESNTEDTEAGEETEDGEEKGREREEEREEREEGAPRPASL